MDNFCEGADFEATGAGVGVGTEIARPGGAEGRPPSSPGGAGGVGLTADAGGGAALAFTVAVVRPLAVVGFALAVAGFVVFTATFGTGAGAGLGAVFVALKPKKLLLTERAAGLGTAVGQSSKDSSGPVPAAAEDEADENSDEKPIFAA